jgi:carbonic anhydrase
MVQQRLRPAEVLTLLQEGNKRFVNNSTLNRDLRQQVATTADSQHPLAVVLSCVDSRVPVEMVFDVGVGDLFVSRVVGNVVNDDVIASLEYACVVSGAKLIVVMGHSGCGAIKAVCDQSHVGHMSHIAQKIQPAVDKVQQRQPKVEVGSQAYLEEVTAENVRIAKQQLIWGSETLSNLIKTQQIAIVAAVYDVKTGEVSFDPMPEVTDVGLKLQPKKIIEQQTAEVLPFHRPAAN